MATTWTRLQPGNRSGSASQSNSETAPSGGVGVDLDDVGGVSVVMHAPSGQTFDGTGRLLGYLLLASAWVRAPRADVDMSDFAGLTDAALPSLSIYAPVGRFIYIPSSVGLSSGTTITSDYYCTTRAGRQG